MKTKTVQHPSGRNGGVLVVVMMVLIAFSLMVIALLQMGAFNAREAAHELRSAQAFWLAEAGRQMCIADLYNEGDGTLQTDLGAGYYEVVEDPDDSNARISTGTVTNGAETVTRRIRINLAFAAPGFEHALYAGNYDNTPWYFQLRGTGVANPPSSGSGGIDSIYGDVYIHGDACMDGASRINEPVSPNRYSLDGDLNTTGASTLRGSSAVAGSRNQNVARIDPPDLTEMDYANNNTYNIAQIFSSNNITSGHLPSGHPLRNVVVKNPSSRAEENASTPGDDFYFEPASISSAGTPSTAVTPLNLGDDQVYYVDGHVWFNSGHTYGFRVNGTATIVATADIHISDNLAYNDRNPDHDDGDLLALVALGKYDSDGDLISGGNVYFGDPRFGTLYTADAFMFAANNFYYNTDSVNGGQEEPQSGFKVFGNFMAVNQVVVHRDWYNRTTYTRNGVTRTAVSVNGQWRDKDDNALLTQQQRNSRQTQPRAAYYDYALEKWIDAFDGSQLHTTEQNTVRHYAMRIDYDDRIRDAATQMPGLPRGFGSIFAGPLSWEEIPPAN